MQKMKKQLLCLCFLLLPVCLWAEIAPDCTYNGIALHGRVKVVEAFADIDVQVVDFLPDLRVQTVSYWPTECGQWQFVDVMPDFTIRFVSALPDVRIQFVDFWPGLP